MTRRSGFTLIEMVVSIVLTAVVSLLVYGAAQAARDTQGRITHERRSLLTALAARILLEGAIANSQTTFSRNDTVFRLESRVNPKGVPQDRISFVASGDLPPLSPGADWLVTLEPTAEGLELVGAPRGIRLPRRRLALLPGVTGVAIRVLVPGKSPTWAEEWRYPIALPQAVELTYWTGSGPIGLPVTVSLALGQVR